MSSDEETAMIRETVAKFVDRELIPLEPHYLKSKLPGSDHPELTVEQKQRLRTVSKDLGLWGPTPKTSAMTCRPHHGRVHEGSAGRRAVHIATGLPICAYEAGDRCAETKIHAAPISRGGWSPRSRFRVGV
jgi:hypothetical protein